MTEIKHRRTAAVIYTSAKGTVRETLTEAVAGGANLRDANLAGANLGGADLGDANLAGANLGGADLAGANLGGADLRGADLGDADLAGADLAGANLGGADLRGADLGDADLAGADLAGADLRGADLRGANLGGANLRGANLGGANLRGADLGGVLADVPLIDGLDAAILAAVDHSRELGKAGIKMSTWHTCESTHCRAGWAIHLAGEKGYALEEKYGPAMAGTLIYLKAGAERIPDWYASDDDALADLRERAGVQA